MPHTGQVLDNPVTGETITIRRTSEETADATVVLGFAVSPGGEVPAPHIHPRQHETFTVHRGRARVLVGEEERILGPGDEAVVPPGVPHSWAALDEVEMTVTLEPGLRADRFFERLVTLTRAGGTDDKGLPTPLHLAVLADDHRDLLYLAGPPIWVQRWAFRGLAVVGRLLGRGR